MASGQRSAGPDGAGTTALSFGVSVRASAGRVGPSTIGTPGSQTPCLAHAAVACSRGCRQAASGISAWRARTVSNVRALTDGPKKLLSGSCIAGRAHAKTCQGLPHPLGILADPGGDGFRSAQCWAGWCRHDGVELRCERSRERRPGRAKHDRHPRKPVTAA